MKKIYAPWRSQYVSKVAHSKKEQVKSKDCIFCSKFSKKNDGRNFILKRYKHVAAILNLYPYNAGHIMVIPFEHKKDLSTLSTETRAELMEVTSLSVGIVKKILRPHGFNVGLNLGKAGGAGIPSHLHMHIVPRWNGDTNFFPVIGETKSVSIDLSEIYKHLKPAFEKKLP